MHPASCDTNPLAPSTLLAFCSLLNLAASYFWLGVGVTRIVRIQLPAILGALAPGL